MEANKAMDALVAFAQERDWSQFHTPENLAKSIAIEAGELLECFQWGQNENISAVRMELADVLSYAYHLAFRLGEDPEALILEKLEITRKKYPKDVAFGTSAKYTELPARSERDKKNAPRTQDQ